VQSLTEGTLVADRYRLEHKLGAGGMGSVWRAHDQSLDSVCAVKLVDSDKVADDEVRIRFQREAKAAARIRCANVVDVFDHGIWNGIPFIVMEYLDGEDLGARLDRRGILSPSEVYEIVVQVARGLVRAHAAGIVHRDLKPENVFLVPGDEHEIAKVLDFGIAKHDAYSITDKTTKTGSFLGTPYYVSPEQARGKPIDWRSDLWSLGIIVFQCLTGKPPFESEALGELMGLIIYEPIPKLSDRNPRLGKALDAWWERAVSRDRETRFQSAKEFADSLAEAVGLARQTVPSMPPRGPSPSSADLSRESQPPVLHLDALPTAAGLPAPAGLDDPDEISRGTAPPVSSTRRSLSPGSSWIGLFAPAQRWFALSRKQRAFVLGVGGAGVLAALVLLLAGLWSRAPEIADTTADPEQRLHPAAQPTAPVPAPLVTPAPEPGTVPVEALELEAAAPSATPLAPSGAEHAPPAPPRTTPRPRSKSAESTPDYGI
jgi:serine/threonine protein kinase